MASSYNSPKHASRADYGVDAPVFQRSALFGGLAGIVFGYALVWLASRGSLPPQFQYASGLVWTGASFFLVGCVMAWGSRFGKLHLRDRIIVSIPWSGREQVLDVGCGHGLLLLAAAKHLIAGRATGIDIWSNADQADNSPEATMRNAQLENVAERIELHSADARQIPFADNSFDVVVSSFAIHNLEHSQDRVQVIREIARVLRPAGMLRIADIRHSAQYAKTLRELGWKDIHLSSPNFLFFTPTRVLRATKPESPVL